MGNPPTSRSIHALRHTFISNLARCGVHPSVAQAPARHCTIALTMDSYTHVLRRQEVEALRGLRDLSIPPSALECNKTGTHGE